MMVRIWALLGIFCVVYAVYVAAQLGFVHFSLDQWRIVSDFMAEDSFAVVFETQNGHHPVIPNLIHYVNWMVLGNSQWPVMWVGFAMAMLAALLITSIILRQSDVDLRIGIVLVCLSTLSLFWIGNGGIFLRANESVHSYPVVIALWITMMAVHQLRGEQTAQQCTTSFTLLAVSAIVACLSFGAGLSLLPAALAVAVIVKAPGKNILILLMLCLVVVTIYVGPWNSSVPGSSTSIRVLEVPVHVLHWLSAPLAAMVSMSNVAMIFGEARSDWYLNELATSIGAFCVIAAILFLAWYAAGSMFGRRVLNRLECILLGTAVAMVGTGVMVVMARHHIYELFPYDVYNYRYFVWSSLFWFATCSLALLDIHSCKHQKSIWPIASTVCFLLTLLMLTSSSVWVKAMWQPERWKWDHVALRLAQDIESNNIEVGVIRQLNSLSRGELAWSADQMRDRNIPVFDYKNITFSSGSGTSQPIPKNIKLQIVGRGRDIISNRPYFDVEGKLPRSGVWGIVDDKGSNLGMIAPRASYTTLSTWMAGNKPEQEYMGTMHAVRGKQELWAVPLTGQTLDKRSVKLVR